MAAYPPSPQAAEALSHSGYALPPEILTPTHRSQQPKDVSFLILLGAYATVVILVFLVSSVLVLIFYNKATYSKRACSPCMDADEYMKSVADAEEVQTDGISTVHKAAAGEAPEER